MLTVILQESSNCLLYGFFRFVNGGSGLAQDVSRLFAQHVVDPLCRLLHIRKLLLQIAIVNIVLRRAIAIHFFFKPVLQSWV